MIETMEAVKRLLDREITIAGALLLMVCLLCLLGGLAGEKKMGLFSAIVLLGLMMMLWMTK